MALTIDGSDPTGDLGDLLDAKLNLAGGKVLQIVRATDTTLRTTTSTSTTDVTGMAVTITPTKDDSVILVIANFRARATTSANAYIRGIYRLTDSANTELSGANAVIHGTTFVSYTGTAGITSQQTLIGYSAPATTSAVTYKLRFQSESDNITVICDNNSNAGQMFAIEVSA